jgi:hypothetical protein
VSRCAESDTGDDDAAFPSIRALRAQTQANDRVLYRYVHSLPL